MNVGQLPHSTARSQHHLKLPSSVFSPGARARQTRLPISCMISSAWSSQQYHHFTTSPYLIWATQLIGLWQTSVPGGWKVSGTFVPHLCPRSVASFAFSGESLRSRSKASVIRDHRTSACMGPCRPQRGAQDCCFVEALRRSSGVINSYAFSR